MEISKKLLFAVCFVSVCSSAAMEDEKALYQLFYNTSVESVDREPEPLINEGKLHSVHFLSNYYLNYDNNNQQYKQYCSKLTTVISKLFRDTVYFEHLVPSDNDNPASAGASASDGDSDDDSQTIIDIRDLETAIEMDPNRKELKIKRKKVMQEDPGAIEQRLTLFQKRYGKEATITETNYVFNPLDDEYLDDIMIFSKNNHDTTFLKNFKTKLLGLKWDAVNLPKGNKTKSCMDISELENLLQAGKNPESKNIEIPETSRAAPEENLSGLQYFKQFLFNYQQAGYGCTVGVAATLGLLKLYSWFWPNKNS